MEAVLNARRRRGCAPSEKEVRDRARKGARRACNAHGHAPNRVGRAARRARRGYGKGRGQGQWRHEEARAVAAAPAARRGAATSFQTRANAPLRSSAAAAPAAAAAAALPLLDTIAPSRRDILRVRGARNTSAHLVCDAAPPKRLPADPALRAPTASSTEEKKCPLRAAPTASCAPSGRYGDSSRPTRQKARMRGAAAHNRSPKKAGAAIF